MNFLKEHKKWFISILIIVSLTMIVMSALRGFTPTWFNTAVAFVVTPVERAITVATNRVTGFFGNLARMGELAAENERLARRVRELEAANTLLNTVEQDNRRLTALLQLSERYSEYAMVGAYVSGRSVDNWFNTFTINKGERDGLKVDMAVLAEGGLCGRIYEVGWNYSKVRPIIDDTSAIAAANARTGDTGFVRGDIHLMLRGLTLMDFISENAHFEVGDEIITGQLSTIYPPGILIGTVTEVTTGPDGSKRAFVKPHVDFKFVDAVLVITEFVDGE